MRIRELPLQLYPEVKRRLIDVQGSSTQDVTNELGEQIGDDLRVQGIEDSTFPEHPFWVIWRMHDKAPVLEHVLTWYERGVLEVFEPHVMSEDTLFKAYLAAGASQDAARVFAAWKKQGIDPSTQIGKKDSPSN
jgi:hypothetical protein